MFLALTALSDSWEKDADILLLGPWCARYDRRRELDSLRWRMLRSPWDDPHRLHAAAAYADEVYERLLRHLTAYLNEVCGVQEPLAYWRLLIGPWLLHFVHAVYDRYVHLSDALAGVSGVRTAVLAEQCFRTPRYTADAIAWLTQEDHYNWQLFSELLALMDQGAALHPCVVPPVESVLAGRPHTTSALLRNLGAAQARVLRAAGRPGRAWLTGITTSRASLLGIAVRSAFRVIPASVRDELRDLRIDPVWNERRTGLGSLPSIDTFEGICVRTLPRHLPTIYLEGYDHARHTIRRRYPHLPSLLVSETGWYSNETYKYLAAEAVGRGTRLVTVQHGAGYGLARQVPLETLERSIGHTFFVWGWANGDPSLRNVPHPIVSRRPRRVRPGVTRILFAPQNMERYLHRLGSTPAGSLWGAQGQWQDRFVGALPAALRRHLTLRPPPVDLGQGVRQLLSAHYPECAVDTIARFKPSVARSRITVLEQPGTGALESLAMNARTVLFWDSNLWTFRDEARPYVEALCRAGIVWDSPEAAAAHVAAVYDDPDRWWQDESVQNARGAFVERFALARPAWIRSWVDAVCDELARVDVNAARSARSSSAMS